MITMLFYDINSLLNFVKKGWMLNILYGEERLKLSLENCIQVLSTDPAVSGLIWSPLIIDRHLILPPNLGEV